MNNMILHLIRHPKPRIANGICYGRLDLLAENSAVVADKLQLELPAGLPLWSSPLLRCRELAECLHPQPMFDERLAEMNFGEWEGRPWDDIPRAQLDAWAADVAGYIPPGGESALALQHRYVEIPPDLFRNRRTPSRIHPCRETHAPRRATEECAELVRTQGHVIDRHPVIERENGGVLLR